MKKDEKKKSNVIKLETPETPRGKDFSPLREYIEKAKKYDALIAQIKSDRESLELDIKCYKENKSFIRIGYVNGYVDGNLSAYEATKKRFDKYLED